MTEVNNLVVLEMVQYLLGEKNILSHTQNRIRVLFKTCDEHPHPSYMDAPPPPLVCSLVMISVFHIFAVLSLLAASSCCYCSFSSSDFRVDFSYCFALEKRSSKRLCKFGSCSNERLKNLFSTLLQI